MPGTNLKAKTSPCLTHTGCFVKQNQVSLHCFFFRKQWTDYLKRKSCTNLYKQHNLQHNLQYFHSKPSISLLTCTRGPLVSLLCTISLAIPTSMPQWWGIAKIFSWWITKLFFFPICISFDISRSPSALLKMWTCVSWTALLDPFRRLQAPRGKMEKSGEHGGADLKGSAGLLPSIQTALTTRPLYSTAPFKEYPAPLQHKLTSSPWIVKTLWTQTWACLTTERQDPLWTEIKRLQL